MSSTQAPFKNELLKKTTFYGQPIASPCLSMQGSCSRSSATLDNSQSFSFGIAGLGGYERLEMENSLGKPIPPLVVALPEQTESKFPVVKAGRTSRVKGRDKSPKKG